MAQDEKKPMSVSAEPLPPLPQVVSGEASDVDNHALPKATPDYAGKYRITHGTIRIGDKFYGIGSVLHLGADDGKNFCDAGVAEPFEG